MSHRYRQQEFIKLYATLQNTRDGNIFAQQTIFTNKCNVDACIEFNELNKVIFERKEYNSWFIRLTDYNSSNMYRYKLEIDRKSQPNNPDMLNARLQLNKSTTSRLVLIENRKNITNVSIYCDQQKMLDINVLFLGDKYKHLLKIQPINDLISKEQESRYTIEFTRDKKVEIYDMFVTINGIYKDVIVKKGNLVIIRGQTHDSSKDSITNILGI